MESYLLSRSKDILKLLFFVDLVLFIISIFVLSKSFTIISLLVNVILIGSYQIIQKYHFVFDMMIGTKSMFKGLNKTLKKL